MSNQHPHRKLEEVGLSAEASDRILLLLGADKSADDQLETHLDNFVHLYRALGSLQNTKLAYSLALRSGIALDASNTELLSRALASSDCVPAGVRLWKTALEQACSDPRALEAAARLGTDGSSQLKVLSLLQREPQKVEPASELSRLLEAPGWESEGSWGLESTPDGAVWWDYALPSKRRSFGMSLASDTLCLKNKLDVQFCAEVRFEILGTTDRCYLEVSTDGRSWHRLRKFEGCSEGWEVLEIGLAAYLGKRIQLRFHVLSGGQREGRGMELRSPRLSFLPQASQKSMDFSQAPDAWSFQLDQGETPVWVGQESEVALLSDSFSVLGLEAPTLAMSAKVSASSIYTEASLQVLDEEGACLAKCSIEGNGEWQDVVLAIPPAKSELSIKLESRFSKRREEDGFWLKQIRLLSAVPESRVLLELDGGFEDGRKEAKLLVEALQESGVEQMEILLSLRRGLPNLRTALALAPMVEEPSQIPGLVSLFSKLKEESMAAFSLLKEVAQGEDFELQSSILLTSGLENYLSTRDHLGDGLLSADEFEQNCRLYLELRQDWTEEQARQGLSLLLTPIANEDFQERCRHFKENLSKHRQAGDFFGTWEDSWAKVG